MSTTGKGFTIPERKVTGPTDPTDPTDLPDWIGALIDGVATANRAAARNREEIAALRYTIIFAAILAVSIYIKNGKG
jgi:hypothetical protein